ncbi:capsid portal protein [Xenorhabdus sp. TS4]|uniref:Capsid portal protein n=1 Tax=Xenorhabdus ehlersii TaxID=290111 RepID=A0A2D0IWN7_9GAMM|nr:capsid portal protein [Xenorhabdus sp. TS4]PHM26321.1 capsid portal protein [Xenorhabdus ehlersii]
MLGQPLTLKHSPAKFTRRGVDLNTYWFVQYGYETKPFEFKTGHLFHLREPDINQELYGLPEYLAAIPSILLNEASTLFRRKYYLNGSHAGYILYATFAICFCMPPAARKAAFKLSHCPKPRRKMNF